MNLDINLIYHNYITRIIIFALFLYKNKVKNQEEYIKSVEEFIIKRCPWKIKVKISYEKFDKSKEVNIFLDEILNSKDIGYLSLIAIYYKTPYKESKMIVDLRKQEEYIKYLNI